MGAECSDGRAKEAIAFHEKAIALDPREPSYYFNCAISYLMLRNIAKALEQQEKLKAIDPAIADRLAKASSLARLLGLG